MLLYLLFLLLCEEVGRNNHGYSFKSVLMGLNETWFKPRTISRVGSVGFH